MKVAGIESALMDGANCLSCLMRFHSHCGHYSIFQRGGGMRHVRTASGKRRLASAHRHGGRAAFADWEYTDRKIKPASVQIPGERCKRDVLPPLHAAHVGAGYVQPPRKVCLCYSCAFPCRAHFRRRTVFGSPRFMFGGESGRVPNRSKRTESVRLLLEAANLKIAVEGNDFRFSFSSHPAHSQ